MNNIFFYILRYIYIVFLFFKAFLYHKLFLHYKIFFSSCGVKNDGVQGGLFLVDPAVAQQAGQFCPEWGEVDKIVICDKIVKNSKSNWK